MQSFTTLISAFIAYPKSPVMWMGVIHSTLLCFEGSTCAVDYTFVFSAFWKLKGLVSVSVLWVYKVLRYPNTLSCLQIEDAGVPGCAQTIHVSILS